MPSSHIGKILEKDSGGPKSPRSQPPMSPQSSAATLVPHLGVGRLGVPYMGVPHSSVGRSAGARRRPAPGVRGVSVNGVTRNGVTFNGVTRIRVTWIPPVRRRFPAERSHLVVGQRFTDRVGVEIMRHGTGPLGRTRTRSACTRRASAETPQPRSGRGTCRCSDGEACTC